MKSQDEKDLHYVIGELRSIQNSFGLLEIMKWYEFRFLHREAWYGRRI